MKNKRISFDWNHTAHIYEMILEHLCDNELCGTCESLQKRFRKFLGKKEVDAITKLIKKNGYCNKLKKSPLTRE